LLNLIFSNLYGGEFYSKITIPEYEPTIDTIDDLSRALDTDYYSLKTFITNFIKRATPADGLYYQMKRFINRTGKYAVFYVTEGVYEMMQNLEPDFIFIATRLETEMFKAWFGPDKFHVGSEDINRYTTVMAVGKK